MMSSCLKVLSTSVSEFLTGDSNYDDEGIKKLPGTSIMRTIPISRVEKELEANIRCEIGISSGN